MNYVMIPRALYTRYELTPTAREAYGLLRSRWDLSTKTSGFRDRLGVFCYYGREELAGMLGVSLPTLRAALRMLVSAGLIAIERQGQGKSDKIYVFRLPEEDIQDSGNVLRLR